MNDVRRILDEVLAQHGQSWSEADRQLIADVLADAAVVGAVAATGQPHELGHIQAQFASISAAASHNVANVARATLERVLTKAASFAIRALGLPA